MEIKEGTKLIDDNRYIEFECKLVELYQFRDVDTGEEVLLTYRELQALYRKDYNRDAYLENKRYFEELEEEEEEKQNED